MTPKPIVEIDRVWQRLKGYGHGLQQPCVRGEITTRVSDGIDLSTLDAYLAEIIIEALPEDFATATGSEGLIQRLIFCTMAITRQHKIPTSYRYHFQQLAVEKNHQTHYAAIPSANPQCTIRVLNWLSRLISAVLRAPAPNQVELDALRGEFVSIEKELGKFSLPGQNTIYFYHAAFELGFPVRHLSANLHCLGQGRNTRYFSSTITDATSSIGVTFARNKVTTANLLKSFGLPVPVHLRATSLAIARQNAEKLGFPVVVKPADQEQGLGVFAGITNQQDLEFAYTDASKHSNDIIVEKHFEGTGHRLTVCLGSIVKVTKKLPGGVIGDGEHTIAQLVDITIEKTRTRQLYAPAKKAITLDDEALGLLAQHGLGPEHVPTAGEYIPLRRKNNATSGGLTLTLTIDEVHPDNLALAIRAANALRLDLAGIDLIIPDITQSWTEVGALICEVNAQPQTDRNTIRTIALQLTAGEPRIPVHLVIYRLGDDIAVDNMAINMAERLGCNVRATAYGVWERHVRITRAAMDGFQAAQCALLCPESESVLCVMSEEDVLAHGLPTDQLTSIHYVARSNPNATIDSDQNNTDIPDGLSALISAHCSAGIHYQH